MAQFFRDVQELEEYGQVVLEIYEKPPKSEPLIGDLHGHIKTAFTVAT
jgi:hypothetical protein